MSISTRCPGCASLFKLPSELAGKRVRCQKCKQMFEVPVESANSDLPFLSTSAPAAATSVPSPANTSPTRPTQAKPTKPVAPPKVQLTDDEVLTGELVDEDAPIPATAVKNLGKGESKPAAPRKRIIDDEDDADEPPPIRRRARRSESERSSQSGSQWMIAGLVGGAFAAILLCGGVGFVAHRMLTPVLPPPAPPIPIVEMPPQQQIQDPIQDAIRKIAAQQNHQMQVIQNNRRPLVVPQNIPPLDVNRGIKVNLVNGTFGGRYSLEEGDMFDPIRRGPAKLFLVALEKDKSYVITHRDVGQPIRTIDPYLRVESPAGLSIAQNDDDGVSLNSAIQLTPSESGTFRIVATVLFPAHGDFQLDIRHARPGENVGRLPFIQPPPVPIVNNPIPNPNPAPNPKATSNLPKFLTVSPLRPTFEAGELTASSLTRQYSVLLTSTSELSIQLTATGFTPKVKVFSAANAQPGPNVVLAEAAADAGKSDVQLRYRPSNIGRFVVEVSSVDNAVGNFTVTLQRSKN